MILNKKFFAPLLIALHVVSSITPHTFHLDQFDYKSAAVLAFFTKRKEKWAILSREGYGITKKHTYDAFSGGRDPGEIDVMLSAAREFHEEGILWEAVHLNLKDIVNFINPFTANNTLFVLAYEQDKNITNPKSRTIRNVTYLVNFNKYKTKLFNNFYAARAKEIARYEAAGIPGKYRHTTEKDRIAKVRWTDLRTAIINQKKPHDPVYVCAYVLDPATKKFNKETVLLRPILVITLRPFFLNCAYDEGANEKIRYYSN